MNNIVLVRVAVVGAAIALVLPWLQGGGLMGFGGVTLQGYMLASGITPFWRWDVNALALFWPVTGFSVALLGMLIAAFSGSDLSNAGATRGWAMVAAGFLAAWLVVQSLPQSSSYMPGLAFSISSVLQQGSGFWLAALSTIFVIIASSLTSFSTGNIGRPSVSQSQIEWAQAYLARYPNGPLADKARSKLQDATGASRQVSIVDDISAWDRISDKTDVDSLQEYLVRHPHGRFSELARIKLERAGIAPQVPVLSSRSSVPPPNTMGSALSDFRPGNTPKPSSQSMNADDLFAGTGSRPNRVRETKERRIAAPIGIAAVGLTMLAAGGYWFVSGVSVESTPAVESEIVPAAEPTGQSILSTNLPKPEALSPVGQLPRSQPQLDAFQDYTLRTFMPPDPITVVATGARMRARPFTSDDAVIVGVASTGEELNVVGAAQLNDWIWYHVKLASGQLAFIRSDLTSAPATSFSEMPLPDLAGSGNLNDRERRRISAFVAGEIRSQLLVKGCWSDHSDMADASRLRATFRVQFNREAGFASPPELLGTEPEGDPPMGLFVFHARRALEMCDGLGWEVPDDYFLLPEPRQIEVEFAARP